MAAASGLLAGALAEWSRVYLAPLVIAPIAMTLLCLGIGLIDWVYWRRYQLAAPRAESGAPSMRYMASFMKLAVVDGAVDAGRAGDPGALGRVLRLAWLQHGGISAALRGSICRVWREPGVLTWQLDRTPLQSASAAGDVWTRRPRGVQLFLRWLGVVAATRVGTLPSADDDPRRRRHESESWQQPTFSPASNLPISDHRGGVLRARHAERAVAAGGAPRAEVTLIGARRGIPSNTS